MFAPLDQAVGTSPFPSSAPPLVRSGGLSAFAWGEGRAGSETGAAGLGRAVAATPAVTPPPRTSRAAADFHGIILIVAISLSIIAATDAGTTPASTAADIPPAART